MSDHFKEKVVTSHGSLRITDDLARRAVKKLKLGDGEVAVLRLEREADAKRHHQLKWLFGYVYKQVSERTGYAIPEVDAMFRGLFLPGDVDTLSLLSYEQMADYTSQCEAYAAETIGVVVRGPDEARRYVD